MATVQKVKKRNGEIVDFEPQKIVLVLQKAFAASVGDARESEAISVGRAVADLVDEKFGNTAFIPSVEDVQDFVELKLMERGYFPVAKAYIIYRYEHEKIREEMKAEVAEKIDEHSLKITKRNGSTEVFTEQKIARTLARAVAGFESAVNQPSIIAKVRQELYEGIKSKDVHNILIMVTRSMIERDPAYSLIASRLLLHSIYREVFGPVDYRELDELYKTGFVKAINLGVELGQLHPEMLTFDLPMLAEALVPERDRDFKYLGLQTLHANYLSKNFTTRALIETPQIFWMRIAMGCALAEKTPEERSLHAVNFYEIMSKMYYTPSSPTLYHAGLIHSQLSSCFLNTVPDDLHAIFKSYSDNAQLLKYAGGLATDWTNIRATNSIVKSTGVPSQGVIPFLKIANDVTISINRSGRRRGAAVVYLEYWHADIEDFMDLRRNVGDERRRAHDLNTAVWIPDLFMQRLAVDGYWSLFSPSDTPDLHDLYGKAFKIAYEAYEKLGEEGKIGSYRRMRASDLWKKNLTTLFETGHPWITWKDPSNIRSPQDHVGVVHSSNLCTEITLNTSANETAVCNLGSLNLAAFVTDGKFNRELVSRVVPVAMRMLDNVITVNFYPTEDTKRSNMRHRPVGMGLRGLQDAMYKMDLRFDSEEGVKFSDESMEVISYYTILSSALLAKERGSYETYKGSKWDRGIFPQDTIKLLEAERDTVIDLPHVESLDWRMVRETVRTWGMRNSNTMANAPTATTANIAGCFPTIEPIYKNLYVKANMAGDFMVVNEFLVNDLKRLGLWNDEMLERLKYHDGSIQDITEIPQALRDKYKEAFQIDPRWLIKAAARRGRWIDQSQSLNIFYNGASGKELSEIYQYAWGLGLKTTYYLRTMGASRVEKATVNMAKFGSTSRADIGVSSGSTVPASDEKAPANTPSPVVIEGPAYAMARTGAVAPAFEAAINQTHETQSQMQTPTPTQSRETQSTEESVASLSSLTTARTSTLRDARPGTYVGMSMSPSLSPTLASSRPKVEIIGSVCESCEG